MEHTSSNVVREKSKAFAIRTIRFVRYLQTEKKDFVLSNQILRSGTSIGANVRESKNAQSTADFINKLNISLKEAYETDYWLRLIHETQYLDAEAFQSIFADCCELEKLLISIIKTTKT